MFESPIDLAQLSPVLDGFVRMLIPLVAGATVILAVLQLAKARRSHEAPFAAIYTLVFGGLATIGLVLLPQILSGLATDTKPSPTPTPSPTVQAPSPTPTPTPLPEPGPPADTGTPLMVLLWIAVALVALALMALAIWSIRKLVKARNERLNKIKSEEDERTRLQSRWAQIKNRHEAMRRNILKAETDWDMLFDLPALTDMSENQTRKLYQAMRYADNAVTEMPPSFDMYTNLNVLRYPKAVREFEQAWEVALANATRISTTKLPTAEIKSIKRIRALLTLAEGVGATEHERHTAYTQIRKLLGGLKKITVPRRALLQIEEKQRLALTA